MKNLAIAVGVFLIVIVVAFTFRPKGSGNSGDTLIPSPTTVESPGFESLVTGQKGQSVDQNKSQKQPFTVLSAEEIKGKKVRIKTAKGDIVFELITEAPIASSNFIALSNKKFYDGLTFHRREEGFVIQGGDPNGNGSGGPGYKFADEKVTRDYTRGIVAMANSGPDTNGSQFFIMLKDAPTLPKAYTIFGEVLEGMDVVDEIKVGDKMEKVTIE